MDRNGKKLRLEKPFRSKKGNKEMAVYVKNPKTGRINLVRFGDSKMRLNKQFTSRKKSYCARSKNLSKKEDKLSPNYWSRKRWECKN